MRPFLPQKDASPAPQLCAASNPKAPRKLRSPRRSTGLVYFSWTALSLILLSLFGAAGPGVAARVSDPAIEHPNGNGLNGGETTEYKVKAAFLYNFISYTTWQKGALPPKEKPIVVAVVGHNPFEKGLDALLKSKQAQGHKLEARYYTKMPKKLDAQVLFVSERKPELRAKIIAQTKGTPILIIGEHPGFASSGAHINFYQDQGKIRFEVNLQSLRSSKLTMSSQLLKLAKIVKK